MICTCISYYKPASAVCVASRHREQQYQQLRNNEQTPGWKVQGVESTFDELLHVAVCAEAGQVQQSIPLVGLTVMCSCVSSWMGPSRETVW